MNTNIIRINTNNNGKIIDNSTLNKNPQNLGIEFFIPHKVVNVRGDGDCFYYALFHALKSKGVKISTIFDINNYNDNVDANGRALKDILEEFRTVRASSISLFKSFSDEALLMTGTASGNSISVRAIGYLMSGHQLHHIKIFKERYL